MTTEFGFNCAACWLRQIERTGQKRGRIYGLGNKSAEKVCVQAAEEPTSIEADGNTWTQTH